MNKKINLNSKLFKIYKKLELDLQFLNLALVVLRQFELLLDQTVVHFLQRAHEIQVRLLKIQVAHGCSQKIRLLSRL